jgi:glycosyltransferase involved in cell wall biosynthesis
VSDRAQNQKLRVLYAATHPIQYLSPILCKMAGDPRLDLTVAFCSLEGAEKSVDPEFGVEVVWDVPLLDGYRWVQVPNRSLRPGLGRSLGLINTGLWKLVRNGKFDAVITQIGYNYASFWILATAAKFSRTPFVFVTDLSVLVRHGVSRWRAWLKPRMVSLALRFTDAVASGSAAGCELFKSIGFPSERTVLSPFVVDNDWWLRESAKADRNAVRAGWRVSDQAPVFLFCAKLQPWKRPSDALRAFARLTNQDSCLVFAGDGPLRADLEAEARALGISPRVRFLGFVNQTQLPGLYCAADLLLLTSEHDACPVVVCEAMLCGCPVILSDSVRGRLDLVHHAVTGFIYPRGDVEALTGVMQVALANPSLASQMRLAARRRMETWSPHECVEGLIDAAERAISRKGGERR